MIERLIQTLRTGFDFGATDLLDALWLAQRMPVPARSGVAIPVAPAMPPELPVAAGSPAPPVAPPAQQLPAETAQPAPQARDSGLVVEAGAAASEGEPMVAATAVRIPAGNALPEGLEIVRSLRTLPKRSASRHVQVLDEEATVDATARAENRLMPVFRPATERLFEAVLVIEQTPSMDVWAQTIVEIERMLHYVGAFRDVRRWYLHTGPNPKLVQPSRRSATIDSLRDPTGRRVIFFFSHGTSDAWIDGSIGRVLDRWASGTPVVFLHALPPSMWKNTILGEPTGVARNANPGAPNADLSVTRAWWSRGRTSGRRVKLPVMSLQRDSAARWAEMLMARKSQTCPAYLVRTTSAAPAASTLPKRTAEERVSLFQANASPDAFRLAVHLSAGPVAIPVIHLLQSALFGANAKHATVAEVMLSGLLQRVTPVSAQVPPEQVVFRFDPEARTILRRSLRAEDARQLCELVQNYIEQQFGNPNDFQTWLRDPKGTALIPASAEPFVELRAGFLEYLGIDRLPEKPKPKQRTDVYAILLAAPSLTGGQWAVNEFGEGLRENWVPEQNVMVDTLSRDTLRSSIEKVRGAEGRLLIVYLYATVTEYESKKLILLEGQDYTSAVDLDVLREAIRTTGIPQQLIVLDLQHGITTPELMQGFDYAELQRQGGTQMVLTAANADKPLWPALNELLHSKPTLLFEDPEAFLREASRLHGSNTRDIENWFTRAPVGRRIYLDSTPENRYLANWLRSALASAGHTVLEPDENATRAEVFLTVGLRVSASENSQLFAAQAAGVPIIFVYPGNAAIESRYPMVHFSADWDRDFMPLLDAIESACLQSDRVDQPLSLPSLPQHFVDRPAIYEQIEQAFGTSPVVVVTGKGMHSTCLGFCHQDFARNMFPGGIYWQTCPLQAPPTAYLSVMAYEDGFAPQRAHEHMLLLGDSVAQESRYPVIELPPFTEQESFEFLEKVTGGEQRNFYAVLFLLHRGDLDVLRYLEVLLTSFDAGSVFRFALLNLEELVGPTGEQLIEALAEKVALPCALDDGGLHDTLRLILIAYGRELPLTLARQLEIDTPIFELGLARVDVSNMLITLPYRVAEALRTRESNFPTEHLRILEACDSATDPHTKEYASKSRVYHLCGAGHYDAAADIVLTFDWLHEKLRGHGIHPVVFELTPVAHRIEAATTVAKLLEHRSDVYDERSLSDARQLRHFLAFELRRESDLRLVKLRKEACAGTSTQNYPNDFVFVAGTRLREYVTRSGELAAIAMGASLARAGFGLITRGGDGIPRLAGMAFAEERRKMKLTVDDALIQVIGRDKPYDAGRTERLEGNDVQEAVRMADAVVIIGGYDGTNEVLGTAETADKPILSFGGTGGVADKISGKRRRIASAEDAEAEAAELIWQLRGPASA